MLCSAPHSLTYFSNGKAQCWHNAAITCVAFAPGVRDYFRARDAPAVGTVLFHLHKWLAAFDSAMVKACAATKSEDRKAATASFNALRGEVAVCKLRLIGSYPPDTIGQYAQTALMMELGPFHDLKEFLLKMLPEDLGGFLLGEREYGCETTGCKFTSEC
jgi:hypothetical protein